MTAPPTEPKCICTTTSVYPELHCPIHGEQRTANPPTDIVERLRAYRGPWLAPEEAADEIERLRADAAHERDDSRILLEKLDAARAENERLRAELERLYEIENCPSLYVCVSRSVHDARLAEIERLRAENEHLTRDLAHERDAFLAGAAAERTEGQYQCSCGYMANNGICTKCRRPAESATLNPKETKR